jgi:hypothetical protein
MNKFSGYNANSNYTSYNNVLPIGKTSKLNPIETCREACTADIDCVGYYIDTQCQMYSNILGYSLLQNLNSNDYTNELYVKNKIIQPISKSFFLTYDEKTIVNAESINSFPSISTNEICVNLCNKDPECLATSYNNSTCELYSNIKAAHINTNNNLSGYLETQSNNNLSGYLETQSNNNLSGYLETQSNNNLSGYLETQSNKNSIVSLKSYDISNSLSGYLETKSNNGFNESIVSFDNCKMIEDKPKIIKTAKVSLTENIIVSFKQRHYMSMMLFSIYILILIIGLLLSFYSR